MIDSQGQVPSSMEVKQIRLAVWLLVVITTINLLISLYAVLLPAYIENRVAASLNTSTKFEVPSLARYNDFHEWPIEKRVREASVIVMTKHRIEEGKVKSVVSEMLKLSPGTTFHYKVGDEYGTHPRYVRENTSYGDGEVIFFTGSPAQMRMSTTYDKGRLLGLGDMPIELLKDLITKEK